MVFRLEWLLNFKYINTNLESSPSTHGSSQDEELGSALCPSFIIDYKSCKERLKANH